MTRTIAVRCDDGDSDWGSDHSGSEHDSHQDSHRHHAYDPNDDDDFGSDWPMRQQTNSSRQRQQRRYR